MGACCLRADARPPRKAEKPAAPAPDVNVAEAEVVAEILPADKVQEICDAMVEDAFLALTRPRKRKRASAAGGGPALP